MSGLEALGFIALLWLGGWMFDNFIRWLDIRLRWSNVFGRWMDT